MEEKDTTDWHEYPSGQSQRVSPDSISITIKCSNDAFVPFWHLEVARFLNELSEQMLQGESIPRVLHDLNGNLVGSIVIK